MIPPGQIRAILRRYNVRQHYRATSAAGVSRYALFGPDGFMQGPVGHAEAQRLREDAIIEDLAALLSPGDGGGAVRPYLGPYPIRLLRSQRGER